MECNQQIIPSSVLHWNYRGFTEFPLEKIRGEESDITDIYLKENLLTRLPADIGRLSNLESLYISGNDITELPREISKLRCLKCLDVSGNRLRRIPDEIGDVKGLKFLLLDENELRELPLRIAELRCLRYLSVCDNKLKWLPQKPVHNYHHCEFRFWRNTDLKCLPYSLWYHMFRDQQTRSLNIGCLNITNSLHTAKPNCRLKLSHDSKHWEYFIHLPHQNIRTETQNSPPTLFELCRRKFYQMLTTAAKEQSTESFSIYSDYKDRIQNKNNVNGLQSHFEEFNIRNEVDKELDLNGNGCDKTEEDFMNKKYTRKKLYNVPADIIEFYYDCIPNFIKGDLCNGPISKCENVSCKNPVFDFAFYEICLGKLTLIDSVEDIVLSAAFCSKPCLDSWKTNKTTIPWTID